MQIRSFQNLMGRTARAGMYTEGSVIVTDPRLFDNRNNRINGGNLRWNDCTKMFDSSASEPCGSSILSLVQDIVIDYQAGFIGSEVAKFIIENYGKMIASINLYQSFLRHFLKGIRARPTIILQNQLVFGSVPWKLSKIICVSFFNDENTDRQAIASEICKETLAYFMANDDEKPC